MKHLALVICFLTMSSGAATPINSSFASEKSQIDLSKIKYVKSETVPDRALEEAFSNVYNLKRGEDKVTYYYNRVDLNNDQIPETFVFLSGPFVCGTGGCSALIFEIDAENQYKLLSRFSLVRTPVIIREKTTNGWKNIVMYVTGGGMPGVYKELIYDGKSYPLNPSIQPDVKDKNIKGVGIINDAFEENSGIVY